MSKNTVWLHYKGNKYIILNIFDNLVCYADLQEWKGFSKDKKAVGNQLQVWLRNKNQWLDIIDNNKLRFNLIEAL
ncbi:MAG: hypothetical protein ACD_58C00168G0005 [uncultured bacterium]|nr:MAG: hypothetical protein ACD_58C00168G0005 [uncultured bacterium]